MERISRDAGEITARINDLVTEITGGDRGVIVNLKGVTYTETYRSELGSSTIDVSCLFINDDGTLCADMYRTARGGFFEFICGKSIDDMCRKGLHEIVYALTNERWSVSEQVRKKTGNRRSFSPLKISFHLRGARSA